jgi:hypothetical protein
MRGIGKLGGVVDLDDGAFGEKNLVGDRRGCLNNLDMALTFEPFLNNLNVEHAEEPTAEAEAEGLTGLRRESETGVVQTQSSDGVAQFFELSLTGGIEIAEDHLLRLAVTGESFIRRVERKGDGIADVDIFEGFDGGDDVADFAGGNRLSVRGHLGSEFADLGDGVGASGAHHVNLVANTKRAVEQPEVDDDSAIIVVFTIKDQRLGFGGRVALGAGEKLTDGGEEFIDAKAGLGGAIEAAFGG